MEGQVNQPQKANPILLQRLTVILHQIVQQKEHLRVIPLLNPTPRVKVRPREKRIPKEFHAL